MDSKASRQTTNSPHYLRVARRLVLASGVAAMSVGVISNASAQGGKPQEDPPPDDGGTTEPSDPSQPSLPPVPPIAACSDDAIFMCCSGPLPPPEFA